jgi:hypothetical protein
MKYLKSFEAKTNFELNEFNGKLNNDDIEDIKSLFEIKVADYLKLSLYNDNDWYTCDISEYGIFRYHLTFSHRQDVGNRNNLYSYLEIQIRINEDYGASVALVPYIQDEFEDALNHYGYTSDLNSPLEDNNFILMVAKK